VSAPLVLSVLDYSPFPFALLISGVLSTIVLRRLVCPMSQGLEVSSVLTGLSVPLGIWPHTPHGVIVHRIHVNVVRRVFGSVGLWLLGVGVPALIRSSASYRSVGHAMVTISLWTWSRRCPTDSYFLEVLCQHRFAWGVCRAFRRSIGLTFTVLFVVG